MSNPNFTPEWDSNQVYYNGDMDVCLTDVIEDMQDDIDGKAPTTHAHTGYATVDHTHTEYAETSHTHTGYAESDHTHTEYATTAHNHDDVYAGTTHAHEQFDITGLVDALSGKAAASHSHTEYAVTGHNHDSDYADIDHNHNGDYMSKSLQFTSDTGDVEVSFTGKDVVAEIKSLSTGFHTAFAPANATNVPKAGGGTWRFLIHKVGVDYAWVMAFCLDGSVFSGCLNNAVWGGWNTIFDANPSPLWAPNNGTGSYYMSAGHTVTPTKKLSECRNGWVLLWCDFNTTSVEPDNYDFCTTIIPKTQPNGSVWAGNGWCCDVAGGMDLSSPYTTETHRYKWLYVYDNKIVGHAANMENGRNDIVLRAVYEF